MAGEDQVRTESERAQDGGGPEAEDARTATTDVDRGLTDAEVADRVGRGLVNVVQDAPTRTVASIVRSNVFTRFNALLGAMLAIILVVGPLQDALFGLVLIANSLIGIIQELRAKRTLDQLTLLAAPKARVVREGSIREVAVGEVVLDDVLELAPGSQVVVDGRVLAADGLEVDESLLSGESDTVTKQAGADVLSGSFVAAGRVATWRRGWARMRTRPKSLRTPGASPLRIQSFARGSTES